MSRKVFLVGAGAIGCELLKGFALMGVGCASDHGVGLSSRAVGESGESESLGGDDGGSHTTKDSGGGGGGGSGSGREDEVGESDGGVRRSWRSILREKKWRGALNRLWGGLEWTKSMEGDVDVGVEDGIDGVDGGADGELRRPVSSSVLDVPSAEGATAAGTIERQHPADARDGGGDASAAGRDAGDGPDGVDNGDEVDPRRGGKLPVVR